MANMRAESLPTSSATTIDRQTLTEIYERFSPDIYRYAYRLLDDGDMAEDCVADTFHRFLMAVRGGTSFENPRAYLYRIAHNWITDYYRRRPPTHALFEDELHVDHKGNPSHL